MRKWEDIVKDKLEGYESALPEDSLAQFHALRAEAAGAPAEKRFPLVWVAALAVAAAVAAFFFLRRPASPENGILLTESADVMEPVVQTAPLIAQVTKPDRPVQSASIKPQEIVAEADTRLEEMTVLQEIPAEPAAPETSEENIEPVITETAPFVPESAEAKPVKMNVGSGAIAAGGGLLTALATQLAAGNALAVQPDNHFNGNLYNSDLVRTSFSHRIPLKVGLSFRIPVSERFGITTGPEYSLYISSLGSGDTQRVHYLGVPVRLDWTFVSCRWLDAYLGAGVKGDICLGATLGREFVGCDGPAFRLLGAGGVQFNATRHLGIYVEPEISWTPPSEKRVLATYSSEHPWMFSVASGIRITFGQK